MDLSPTDLQLVSYDKHKADENYNFKLTDILRRRQRPLMFIIDKFGELIYGCKPDGDAPDHRLSPTITEELIGQALREAQKLIRGENEPARSVTGRPIIEKPGETCALIVLQKRFWCLRIFELDGGAIDVDSRFAVLVDPVGDPQSGNVDLRKVKGLFRLSNREADVVEELVSGSTDKEIAQELGISVETVRAYLKSVRAKLGVSTRTAIVSVVHNVRDGGAPPTD